MEGTDICSGKSDAACSDGSEVLVEGEEPEHAATGHLSTGEVDLPKTSCYSA